MLPEFDLLTPQTLPEALEMLADGAPEVVPLAGGTNLVPDMRSGRFRPGVMVNVAGLDTLQTIRQDDGHIVVGGGVTIADLLTSPLIAEHGAPLRQAAAVLGSPLVRNRATLAGNLADASPAADTAPPLLVLGAEVELASKNGTRRVPLDEFFVGVRETLRQPHELLVAVRWPLPPEHSAGGFHKIGLRKADAISVLSVAVMIESDRSGFCRQARIALGAVAPKPIRAHAAEEVLRNQSLAADVIAQAAFLSAQRTRPIEDIRGSVAYRRRVVEVITRRLLSCVQEVT